MSLSIYVVENFDKVNIISRSVSIKMWTASFRQDKKRQLYCEAARRERKTSCYLTLLSCRWQGQDLTLRRWLVDIFRNMQINLIGSFDCSYWGDTENISHLISFGKFCLPLPGRKIVCKISENCKVWQATHLHWRKTFENLLHIASVRRTLSGILHFKHWPMI